MSTATTTITHDNRRAIAGTTARHLVWTSNGQGLRTLTCNGKLVGEIERTADGYVARLASGYVVGFPKSRAGIQGSVDMLLGAAR